MKHIIYKDKALINPYDPKTPDQSTECLDKEFRQNRKIRQSKQKSIPCYQCSYFSYSRWLLTCAKYNFVNGSESFEQILIVKPRIERVWGVM